MTCNRCGREIDGDSAFCRFCGAGVHAPPPLPHRQLTRRPDDGRLGGVCAGLAEYFDLDVAIVRLAWVVLAVVPGAVVGGVVAYLAAWIVIPAVPGTAPARVQRLTRSATDRYIGGVCGGLAAYAGVEATIVRVAWVLLTIVPGAIVLGVLAYLVAWFILPEAPGWRPQPAVPDL